MIAAGNDDDLVVVVCAVAPSDSTPVELIDSVIAGYESFPEGTECSAVEVARVLRHLREAVRMSCDKLARRAYDAGFDEGVCK